jgi:hypothetical protein
VVKIDGEFISIGTTQTATDRTITPEDVAGVAKLPSVTKVAPHQDIESLVVSAGRNKTNTWLVGLTPAYSDVQNQQARTGRLISATDVSFGRSVMELGLVPAEKLFPGLDPIGQTVRVGNQEFEVVGVQSRRGKLADENLDNRIFVPLPLVTGVLLGGGPNTVHLDLLVSNAGEIEPTMDTISTLLRRQHQLPASYPDDFSVEDQASIVKEGQRATTTFRILTFALGGIALLVGGNRDHEHDARLRPRADARDRHPEIGRSGALERPGAVPDRGDRLEHARRHRRRDRRPRRHQVDQRLRGLANADQHSSRCSWPSWWRWPSGSCSATTRRGAHPASIQLPPCGTSEEVSTVPAAIAPRQADTDATLLPIHEVALFLRTHLGKKTTAYLSGVTDPKMVTHWIARHNIPRERPQMRLREAYRAAELLVVAHGDEAAKAWFVGSNAELGRPGACVCDPQREHLGGTSASSSRLHGRLQECCADRLEPPRCSRERVT